MEGGGESTNVTNSTKQLILRTAIRSYLWIHGIGSPSVDSPPIR